MLDPWMYRHAPPDDVRAVIARADEHIARIERIIAILESLTKRWVVSRTVHMSEDDFSALISAQTELNWTCIEERQSVECLCKGLAERGERESA
jgi:hypothetical protein